MKQGGGKIMRVRCALSTLMGREKYQIQDVHEKTGLSRSTVSNLYNEKSKRIDYDTILKLCSLFDCEISELLYLEHDDER